MDIEKVERAQQGVLLMDVTRAARRLAAKNRRPEMARARARAGALFNGEAGVAVAAAAAAMAMTGPFLSAGSLTMAERLRLLDGFERVIDGLYTHLPLKRARYGFEPVQRLRILRVQADTLDDDAFHFELTKITTELRDAHTRYAGPSSLVGVASLPFLVEAIGGDEPVYVVSKVDAGLDADFQPGVVLEYWNGVPIDVAVMRHGDNEVGGRPDSRRAWATQSLTFRSLRYGLAPDEHWVVVGYRLANAAGEPVGAMKETRIHWRVVNAAEIASAPEGASLGAKKAAPFKMGVDPAASDVRRAKMLMFAPGALVGEQAKIELPKTKAASKPETAKVIATNLTQTLRLTTVDAPGGPYGHLRIFAFDAEPGAFVSELQRLLPLAPQAGLIVDLRGNPGGYIVAAELALQLFSPKPIQPTRFSMLATPFTRDMAGLADLAEELAPWKASLTSAVRNGELYSQALPITDPAECNSLGQHYGGPVVLVTDSTTYSSGDLFSAGFADNDLGPIICVGHATGAGGANVWNYSDLRPYLQGSSIVLPPLPDGIDLSFSFRRATRSGPSEGMPIEDVGIAGQPYALTRDDLLAGNRDLLAKCIGLLREQKRSHLSYEIKSGTTKIAIKTAGLTRLDCYVDGRPFNSFDVDANATTSLSFAAGASTLDLVGFDGDALCQRRRIGL